MAVNVNSVNDAPTAVNSSVTINEDSTKTFAVADFQFTDTHDSPANGLAAVIITSLTSNGTLFYNGVAITAAQAASGFSLSSTDLTAAKLSTLSLHDALPIYYASFNFKVQDNGG